MGAGVPGPASVGGRGPGKLDPEFVRFHQRARVVAALVELVHESGVQELVVSGICRAARMGRATFYELFGSVSECLRYSFEVSFETLVAPLAEPEFEAEADWLVRIDHAVGALYQSVVEHPLEAELCLLHCFSAAEASAGHDQAAVVSLLADALAGGREAARARLGERYREPAPMCEEFLAQAIVALATNQLRSGQLDPLLEHRWEMVTLAAVSFFGPEQGARLGNELRQG